MIRYLKSGESVGADKWDAFYAEADAKMGKALSNVALPATDYTRFLYDRIFWFLPRVPADQTDWSNFSEYAVISRLWERSGLDIYARLYDHSVFTDMVNGLPLASPVLPDVRPAKSDKWKVARLEPDDPFGAFQTTWAPKLYPDAPNPFGFPAIEALHLSLECHTRIFPNEEGKPTAYNVFIDSGFRNAAPFYATGPEYIHRWTPVDIVVGAVGATLFFGDQYNKYNIFRFHNLQATALTIIFGPPAHHSVTIPPMQSRCVRRTAVNGTYTDGYKYFQKPLDGDPWFLNRQTAFDVAQGSGNPYPGQWSNVTDVMCGAYMASEFISGDWFGSNIFFARHDFSKAWDVSGIYNNANYKGGRYELAMPAGGWFGSVGEGTLIGDLAFHKGQLLVVDPAGDFLVWNTQAMTVDPNNDQHILKKADGSTALGVQNTSVTRINPDASEESIPELSAGDRNWLVDSFKDGSGNPIYFYIVFVVRFAGNDPKLAAGDRVRVRFQHKTDDKKHLFSFDGMASLASKLADAGIILDQTPSFPGLKDFTLRCDPPRDLIGVSCNLILNCFGVPGVTIGNDSNGTPSVVFPFVSHDSPRRYELDKVDRTAQYWKWDWDGTQYLNVERVETNPWQNGFRNQSPNQEADLRASYFDSVGSLLTQYRALSNTETVVTASIVMTIFGPRVLWKQTMNTAYGAPGFFEVDGTTLRAFYRDGFAPLAFATLFGFGTTGQGWPNFDSPGGMPVGALRKCFPRVERYWAQRRFFSHRVAEEPFVPTGVTRDIATSEDPLVKSFYEAPADEDGATPLSEGLLVPVAQAGSNAAKGVALLGDFGLGDVDIWPRFSAWLRYSVITFEGPGGNVVYDFTKGGPYQAAYYNIERGNILQGAAGTDDGIGLVKKELPISIEHYNAAASAINVTTSAKGVGLSTSEAAFLRFAGAPINSIGGGHVGFGLGAYYESSGSLLPRPRQQWIGWDVEINAGVSEFFERLGFPIKGQNDFPSTLQDFLNANYLFAVWNGNGGFHTEEVITDIDPNAKPVPLRYTEWSAFLFGIQGGPNTPENPNADLLKKALDNYRWISITDAIAMHQRLGLPFIFQELSVPMFLHVRDAAWNVLATRSNPGGGAGLTVLPSRAANFVNAEGGDWVVNPDAPAELGGQRIVAAGDHEQTDYCTFEVGFTGDLTVLYDAAFPDGIQKRIYGGAPVTQTQADLANEFYLYRNYGGAKKYSVVIPRNYARYRKNFNNTFVNYEAPGTPFDNRPRDVNNGLEGGDADIKELGPGETEIGTTVANGELQIMDGYRDL